MTTLLLVLASLVVGFSGGFIATYHYMVLPAHKHIKEQRNMTLTFLDDQISNLKGILEVLPKVEADGSMISPIQIKKEE